MTEQQRDELKKLYLDNKLTKDDIFTQSLGGKAMTIITRPGIEKIAANNGISIRYEAIVIQPGYAVIKAIGTMGKQTIETFGSADAQTSHNKYYAEMAEKRAMSRVVLKLMRLYEAGVYGEDEADDFKRKEA